MRDIDTLQQEYDKLTDRKMPSQLRNKIYGMIDEYRTVEYGSASRSHRKNFGSITGAVAVVAAMCVAGVITVGVMKHGVPHSVSRYSALSQVPAPTMETFKQKLEKAPIKNIELPTNIPFTVTSALVQSNTVPPQVTIQLYGKSDFLEVNALPDPNNTPPSTKTNVMPNVKSISLPDGSKALYGNNGAASMLDWAKGGVEYSLASTNAQNKPDLTEKQLVSVANSFQ